VPTRRVLITYRTGKCLKPGHPSTFPPPLPPSPGWYGNRKGVTPFHHVSNTEMPHPFTTHQGWVEAGATPLHHAPGMVGGEERCNNPSPCTRDGWKGGDVQQPFTMHQGRLEGRKGATTFTMHQVCFHVMMWEGGGVSPLHHATRMLTWVRVYHTPSPFARDD
jgi:hypothetical protein